MTEPIFKAPLPPENSGFTPPAAKGQVEELKTHQIQDLKQRILPYLWYVLGGTFFVGLILGMAMSGGDSVQTVAPKCPVAIVTNPDIQQAFPLCGRTSKTNECILLVMNTDRYDHYAEDFFSEAERLMERSRYSISMDNPTYSKLPVPPGAFAQIKIPAHR